MTNEIITTLHPDNNPDIDLYPNIKKDNIPNNSIDTTKLDQNVISLIGSLKPNGVDTSTHILAFTSNKGIYVGSDTGNWYYWDGTQYVSGGLYLSNPTNINNNIYQLQNGLNNLSILTPTYELGSFINGVEVSSTTRARSVGSPFFNNIDLFVKCSYRVDIIYYDESNNYIGETGWLVKPIVMIPKNSYFRILLSKTDNSTITDGDLETMFKTILISFNIDEFKNIIYYNKNAINTNLLTFELGNVDASTGEDVPSNVRVRSNLFIPTRNLKFILPNYVIVADYFDKGRWYGGSWDLNGYIYLKKGVQYRIILKKLDETQFDDYEIIEINNLYRIIVDTDDIETIEILDYPTISKYETEYVAHCSMGVIKDGKCYVAYYGDDVDEIEAFTNLNTKIRLSKFNICKPEDTNIIEIAKVGDTYDNITFNSQSPYDPNILLLNNDLLIYFRPYYNGDEHIVIRKYDISNDTLANNIIECKLIYNNTLYDFTRSNVIDIYNDNIGTSFDIYTIIFSSHIVKYNNEYYALISGESPEDNNFGGILVKSSDGINWSIVKCFESTSRSMEMDLTITSLGLVYIVERIYQSNNSNIFTYDINSGVVSDKKDVSPNTDGKSNMMLINNDVYLIHNTPNSFIAKGNVYRSKLSFAVIDNKLNINTTRHYLCDNGVHYPCMINYNNVVYMLFTSDKKEVSRTYDRSNIGFLRIKNLGD